MEIAAHSGQRLRHHQQIITAIVLYGNSIGYNSGGDKWSLPELFENAKLKLYGEKYGKNY